MRNEHAQFASLMGTLRLVAYLNLLIGDLKDTMHDMSTPAHFLSLYKPGRSSTTQHATSRS